MTEARRSHEQKTRAERESYVNTTVRRVPSPTVDEPFLDRNSTEAITESGQEYNRVYPTKSEGSIRRFFREKWVDLVIGLAVTIVLAVLGWAGLSLYSLNREVGELRKDLDAANKREEGLQQQLDRTETRLESALDRLDQRIDRNAQQGQPPKER